jgi:hypothetical protein
MYTLPQVRGILWALVFLHGFFYKKVIHFNKLFMDGVKYFFCITTLAAWSLVMLSH